MAGEAEEFFLALMFGSGAWLGLILIVAIMVTVTAISKFGGIPMLIIGVFIGIEYFENVAVSSNFYWAGIIMFILSPLLAIYSTYRIAKN